MICAAAIIINLSLTPINTHDKKMLWQARLGCERNYPDYPCVKYFYKMEERVHRVICGRRKNNR